MSTTIHDLASDLPQIKAGKAAKGTVTDGLQVQPFDPTPGYRLVSPEQLASLVVPTVEYGTTIEGFQRPLIPGHARKIAKAMETGKQFPPILVSIDENGVPLLTDGQHRSIGAIITGKPIAAVVEYRTRAAAKQIFGDQGRGAKVSNDTLILSGTSDYDLYVQDALTSDDNPWSKIVGPGKVGGSSAGMHNRISPYAMKTLLVSYVGDQAGTSGRNATDDALIAQRWDTKLADELASLLMAFGGKGHRPDAYTSKSLRAIGVSATLILRRTGRDQKDIERWMRHMPKFAFEQNGYMSITDLTDALLNHWNKKLHTENRIHRPRN